MRLKSTTTINMLAFLFISTILISCNKEHTSPVNPPQEEKNLTVNLRNSIVSVAEVDSADVVLTWQGSANPIYQRLVKGTDFLQTTIDGLHPGQWKAEIDLYTKKLPSGKSYQHKTSKAFTVTGTGAPVNVNGPTAQPNDDWKTRLVLATSDNDIVVIIPADPGDPYFEFRTKGLQWNFFTIERTAVLGTAVVSHKTWQCNGDCPGSDRIIYNNDFFIPFTDKIKTGSWSRSDINITVGNTQNQQYNDFSYQWQQ